MTRIKEGLAKLLSDLEPVGRLEVDADTLGGYFGERPLTDKQAGSLGEQLARAGYSVQNVVVIFKDVAGYRAFPVPETPAPLDLSVASLRALSIRQPHVERILSGEKNIEYRSWQVRELGPLLLHASNTREAPELFAEANLEPERLTYGALVGVVDVLECLYDEENGDYEWLLAQPRRFHTPIPYKGAAGIFRVLTEEVRASLERFL